MRFEEGDFYPSGKKEEDALMHSPSIAIGWLRKNNKKKPKNGWGGGAGDGGGGGDEKLLHRDPFA